MSAAAPITPLHVARLVAGDGDPDAPPIIALHGFTGDATTWARFADAWRAESAAHGGVPRAPTSPRHPSDDAAPASAFDAPPASSGGALPALLAVDLVGHGRSPDPADPAAYRLGAHVASVCAALDAEGIARAVWLGYSMGGRVALAAAVARPERVAGLVLVSASPGIADDAERAERAAADADLAAAVERDGVAAFVERWAGHPLFATQARLGAAHAAAARAQRLGNRAAALAHSLREAGAGAMPPLWGGLAHLAMPVLVVTGALDAKYEGLGRAMIAAISGAAGGARHVVVAGAGHAVQYEEPAALAAAVAAWIGDVSG